MNTTLNTQLMNTLPSGDGAAFDAAPSLDLSAETMRELTLGLLGRIERHYAGLREQAVAPDLPPRFVQALLPQDALPDVGEDPLDFVPESAELLLSRSTFNGHPRFFGYITSSAAPIGALADLLAASINANVGSQSLAPIATEIEAQVVRWIAQLIGFPDDGGGLLVSGGNMANITCALTARTARADWDLRRHGMQHPEARRMAFYATDETHTWLDKAVDVMGLGTDAVRRIATDQTGRMRPEALREALAADREARIAPAMVIATAGTVSTGTVDPIEAIAAACREHGVWLHVDGAYGGLAAALPEASGDLRALALADSVAIDPHKWLYAPLEAGCVLVRDPEVLRAAFSHKPPYYHFDGTDDDPPINYHEYSLQNSRGFRALKVWFILRQLGRKGCVNRIRTDISLSRTLHQAVGDHPLLETFTQELSISTFRFVPSDLRDQTKHPAVQDYLNRLNERLLTALQRDGRLYLSNAVRDGQYVLRACIVNFRTAETDTLAVPGMVAELGTAVDASLRSSLHGTRMLR